LTTTLAAVAAVYVALGAAAFLMGGFDLAPFGSSIGVHHPQKLWNIAAGLLVIAAGARIFSLSGRLPASVAEDFGPGDTRALVYAAAFAFAIGYAPALAAYAIGGGSPPIGRTDLAGTSAALSPFVREIVPIVVGFRSPATGWLGLSLWLGLPVLLAIVASFIALKEQPFTPLFHLLIFTTPVIFLLSGAFIDAQSYRYLMPAYGGLAVVMAVGVWRIFRRSRVAGAVSLVCILALFGLQQRAWYRQLKPDVQSWSIIDCLDRQGVHAAFGDYWVGYKVTFLTGERIIVAPENGVDRYPPYTAVARTQRSPLRIPATMGLSCTQDTSLLR
jgi:hypothetical protein